MNTNGTHDSDDSAVWILPPLPGEEPPAERMEQIRRSPELAAEWARRQEMARVLRALPRQVPSSQQPSLRSFRAARAAFEARSDTALAAADQRWYPRLRWLPRWQPDAEAAARIRAGIWSCLPGSRAPVRSLWFQRVSGFAAAAVLLLAVALAVHGADAASDQPDQAHAGQTLPFADLELRLGAPADPLPGGGARDYSIHDPRLLFAESTR